MRLFMVPLVALSACITPRERCAHYSAGLQPACLKSVEQTGHTWCFHQFAVMTNNPDGYRECSGGDESPLVNQGEALAKALQVWCSENHGELNVDLPACIAMARDYCTQEERGALACAKRFAELNRWPIPLYCKSNGRPQPTEERCLWEQDHPLETKCEAEVKARGVAFYDCMRFYEEREAREQQAEREDRRDRATAADRQRQQEEREAEAWARSIEAMGEAFKPKPTTTCTSRPTYGGQVETVCQ